MKSSKTVKNQANYSKVVGIGTTFRPHETHLLLYLYFCYQPAFLKATTYPKEIINLLTGYRPWDSGKFIKATPLRTCR